MAVDVHLQDVTPASCRHCGSADVVVDGRTDGIAVVVCSDCQSYTSPETMVIGRRIRAGRTTESWYHTESKTFAKVLEDVVAARADDPPDAGDDVVLEVVVLRRKTVTTKVEVL